MKTPIETDVQCGEDGCREAATEKCCACRRPLCLTHLLGYIDAPKPKHGDRGKCCDCDYTAYRNTYGGM